MLAGHQRQAGAFRAGNHHQRIPGRHLRNAHATVLRQADHRVAGLLELFEGAVQVHHPCDRKVLQGTGGNLGNAAREAGVATLGYHHPLGREGLRRAHNRAQVVGVGDAVHGHQQGRFTALVALGNQRIQLNRFGRRHLQHDALMHRTIAQLGKAGPGDLFHHHTSRPGLPQRLHEAGVEAQLRRTPDAMNGALAVQRRFCRVAAPHQIVRHRRRVWLMPEGIPGDGVGVRLPVILTVPLTLATSDRLALLEAVLATPWPGIPVPGPAPIPELLPGLIPVAIASTGTVTPVLAGG